MDESSSDYYISEELNPNAGFWVRARKIIASVDSKYQKVELIDTESYGLALRIDNYWMTSEKDEFFYHENMVHPPAVAFGNPKNVLIIGGGDGGAAEEYLKYDSIKRVVMVELDEQVVSFCKAHLPSIHRGAFDDPRLLVKIADGREYVEQTDHRYDLMMLDLTDPFGPAEALYGVEFLTSCRRILGSKGVLSIHLGSPIMRPRLFGRLLCTLKAVFRVVCPFLVYVPLYGTWWGMATASDVTDPSRISKSDIEKCLSQQKINDLQFYNSDTHASIFALPNFVKDITRDKSLLPVSMDHPLDEFGLNPLEHETINITKKS